MKFFENLKNKIICTYLLKVGILFSCHNTTIIENHSEIQTEINKFDKAYKWTKLLDSADWKESYNFQMFSINDTLWTFHSDGIWHSTNGKQWIKSPLTNSINNLAFLDYIYYKGSIYGLGYFKGNIERFTFKPEIYKTADFKTWTVLAKTSNLPKRFFYHPFVFDNKIWLIGGEDESQKYSDIWNSTDGINWIKQKENLPFGKRNGSQIINLDNTLYLLDNDVWSSKDGLNWNKITEEIVKDQTIFGYSALVFDNKIWLIGCNRNGQFSSQVLHSLDGKKWQTHIAPWLPRGGIAATIHNNKIYMTGGKYGGTNSHPNFTYYNDVWTLEKIHK